MVNRLDIRKINVQVSELIDAVDELEDLHAQSERSGVTVDSTAYTDAQQTVKDAVQQLVNHTDDMVDRTGKLEDENGNSLVDLPEAALARDGSSTTKPALDTTTNPDEPN